MAENKLQELIETLKKQAVETGETASRKIIEEAQQQAEGIVEKARAEADTIVSDAKAEADKNLKQLQSSMEIAASQFVTNLKRVIEENLLSLPLKGKLTDALADTETLKDLLKAAVVEFTRHTDSKDLLAILSEDQREKLKDFAVELAAAQGDGASVKLQSGNVSFGFMISRTDGNVRLDFTDEAFLTLFLQFLTPRFRELFKDIKLGDAAAK